MKRLCLALILLLGALLYIPASTATVSSSPPPLQAYCTNLITSSKAVEGRPSNLTFHCSGHPAFVAHVTITPTPSFTLPAGYSALYITGPITRRLTSLTPITLPAGNYRYLAQYNGAGFTRLSTFSITWSS